MSAAGPDGLGTGPAGRWRHGLVIGLAIGGTVPAFALLVQLAGRWIQQPHVPADYLAGILWALALGASIPFWPVSERDRRALLVLWGARCAVTLGFMLAYEWHYPVLDAYSYFHQSLAPRPPVDGFRFGLGTDNVVALAWIHSHLLAESYHALKVSFAMVGLLGIYLFYRAVVRYLGEDRRRLLYLLGLFPSILFWSSILGKDPVGLFGMGLYAYGVVAWRRTGRWRHLLTVALGILVASCIRFWMLPIMAAPLVLFAFLRLRGILARLALLMILAAALWKGAQFYVGRLGLDGLAQIWVYAEGLSRGWEGGSAQALPFEFTGLRSMALFLPLGAFTALFRPLPGEVLNPFGLLAGLENLVLVGMLALAIGRFRFRKLRDPLVLWALLLVCAWSGVYAFVSYYNFGAAVRFKLQVLPFLLMLLLHLSRRVVPARGAHASSPAA